MAMKRTIIRAGLETLYFSGAYQMMRPFVAGVGAILTLHHVRPPRPELFQPNRLLEITPQFLDEVLIDLRRGELDLVSERRRPFVPGEQPAGAGQVEDPGHRGRHPAPANSRRCAAFVGITSVLQKRIVVRVGGVGRTVAIVAIIKSRAGSEKG